MINRKITYNAISHKGQGFVLSNMDYYFFYPEGIKSNLLFNFREKKNSTVSIDNDEYQVNESMGQIMITNDSG